MIYFETVYFWHSPPLRLLFILKSIGGLTVIWKSVRNELMFYRKNLRKGFSFLALGLLLAAPFQNCARQSQYEGLSAYGVPLQNENLAQWSVGNVGIRVLNAEAYMHCYQHQIQIGGVCNHGGAQQHYIRYSLKRDGNPVKWIGDISYLNTRCDQGRWTAIVPIPDDSTLMGSGPSIEYELKLELFVWDEQTLNYRSSFKAPLYTLSIEPNGACL